MPELGVEARKAIDRHLESVGDHLAAVMWECAFAIVRAAEERAPDVRPAGVDSVVQRIQSEAERITDDLTALRVRSAAAPAPPAPPSAVTWTPADGLAPEPFDEEPEDEGAEPEDAEPEDTEPEEPEPEAEEPAPSGSGRRRASMHDNPVWSMFHRTESRGSKPEPEPEPEPEKPAPAPKPEARAQPASSGGNERLIELARTVEKRAGGTPPAGSGS